jgi:cobalt/nickel transport system ATP-binding protein
MSLLSLNDVSFAYPDGTPAVSNVTLSIAARETWAVIGANGSGKSTLLQLMGGLRHPDRGQVLFAGKEVSRSSLKEKAFLADFRSRVGYVFQDAAVQLFCPTVSEELMYGPRQLGLPEAEVLARTKSVQSLLQISHLEDRPPYMLSGGEKKRVAIGSVLTMNPDVLLLDEPMTGLDPRAQRLISDLLHGLSEAGRTLVIATHDWSLVEQLGARVAVLSEEHGIARLGTAADILSDAELLIRANIAHEHGHHHGNHVHRHVHVHPG